MPYLPRLVDSVLEARILHHPAILVVGPRAAGKTTSVSRFARSTLRLDRPAQAAVVRADPDVALAGLAEPVLIDEWQVVPEVLSAVKRAVDAEPRPGRFPITGSVRGDIDSPTWPGTGRLVRVAMYGLTVAEMRRRIPKVAVLDRLAEADLEPLLTDPADRLDLRGYAELALLGGFPDPVLRLPDGERSVWLESYIEQLLARDLAGGVSGRRDVHRVRSFFEAYALNTAGLVDRHTLYTAAGITKATGEAYEQLLRNLLVVDILPAWWTNRLKRLARSPKRYVVDPSLALAALRLDLAGLMRDGDLLGRALDTLVVAQLRAELPRCTSRPRLHHLRQEQGRHEVDVLVEYGGGRVFGLEIKAAAAVDPGDARHLRWLRDALGDRFVGGAVLHTGPRAFVLDGNIVAAPIACLWNAGW